MKRIFKVILLTLIACSVRFIFSNVVNAETYGVEGSAFTSSEISSVVTYYNTYKKSDYEYFSFSVRPGDSYGIVNFFNSDSNIRLIATGNNIASNITATGEWWRVRNGSVVTKGGDFSGIMGNTFGYDNTGKPYFYGNLNLYDSSGSIIWSTDIPTELPPVIQNFEFTNVVNSMVAGEYFDIIVIANGYANTDIQFNINNGTLVLDEVDDDTKYKYILLNSDSPYLMPTSEGSTAQGWKIPKSALIPIYDNCVYNMWLTYGDNLSLSTETQTLTTSFSELGKSMAMTDTQDATQDIANYLNNDEVNDADFDLPEIDVNDFTLNFFSSLVGSITDAFLDTTYDESITFDVRGTTYTIHSTEFDILGKVGLGVLKNFTALLWVFGIGYWIYCDARKRIMKLKEFNWTAMFADDISVDML